jgi:hypothetical protein
MRRSVVDPLSSRQNKWNLDCLVVRDSVSKVVSGLCAVRRHHKQATSHHLLTGILDVWLMDAYGEKGYGSWEVGAGKLAQ